MKKWEYKIVCSNQRLDQTKDLNQLGKEGWEIAAATSDGALREVFLKRELQ